MLGRRGPAQAAFTSAEYRELGHMTGVALTVDNAELDPVSQEWLDTEGTFTARRNVKLTQEFAAREPDAAATRRITLRFLQSPVAILGDSRVEGITTARTELYRDDAGAVRARVTEEQRDDRVRPRAALRRLPRRPAARRPLRRARLRDAQRARPRAARRLLRWLDQARPDRHPRHQQARRRGDGEDAARGHRRAARPARDRRRRAARQPRRPPPAGPRSTASSARPARSRTARA